MEGKVKRAGLVFTALKAGQQVLHDLDAIIMNDTSLDLARYTTEQYVCKIGSTAIAAYAIDKAVSYLEELVLPKFMRGMVPVAAATIGAGAVIHYGGEYMNMEAGANLVETTRQLITYYQGNLTKLIALDPNINEGCLIGSLIVAKSGVRWLKNMGEALVHYSDKKKQTEKYKQQQEINNTNGQNKQK